MVFGKLLQKLGGGKDAQFQRRVTERLRNHYPNHRIEPGPDPQSVLLNGINLNLQELHEVCQKNEMETDSLIVRHFSHPVALMTRISKNLSWSEASDKVRPQFFPAKYRDLVPVLSFPFSQEISAGIVIPSEAAPFLWTEDLKTWGVTPEEAYRKSLANLDGVSMDMETTVTDGTDRFVGMETHDGYDAVRILLPRVRKHAAEKLGEPYLAGIPNRSFVILWSRGCSQRFQDYAVEKVEGDFDIQSYPLSKKILEVTLDSIKPAP